MSNALIYSRVSTEEQATSDRHSLRTQRTLCEKAITERGFILAENGLYEDPGRSATNMSRPGLQDLLLRVQEDKSIKAVFVQDTDRLARNAGDHLTIKALLRKHEVCLISVSQPGLEDTPEGNLMDIMIAGFNQFQSQLTGRKSLKSMEQKFWDGGWPTRAPVGYLNVGEKDNEKQRTIIIDPIRGSLIREAFELYATGDYSIIAILDLLHEKGFRARCGKRIAFSKFAEIFQNHFYYGEMRWKDLVNQGKHEPLISKELFDRCQFITQEHRHHASRRRKHNFVLRGFIRCALCGCRYTASHNVPKKKSYYYCNHYKNNLPGNTKCADKYVEVDDLENQVQIKFDRLQFSDEFITRIENRLKIIYENRKSSVGSEEARIEQAKSVYTNKLQKAEEKLLSGVLDDSSFERIKRECRQQIASFDGQISKLELAKNVNVDVIQQVLALARDIGASYRKADPDLKRLYLGLFWQHFEAKEKRITKSIKAPIILALEAIGAINDREIQKPIPSPISKDMDQEVIKHTVRGA